MFFRNWMGSEERRSTSRTCLEDSGAIEKGVKKRKKSIYLPREIKDHRRLCVSTRKRRRSNVKLKSSAGAVYLLRPINPCPEYQIRVAGGVWGGVGETHVESKSRLFSFFLTSFLSFIRIYIYINTTRKSSLVSVNLRRTYSDRSARPVDRKDSIRALFVLVFILFIFFTFCASHSMWKFFRSSERWRQVPLFFFFVFVKSPNDNTMQTR